MIYLLYMMKVKVYLRESKQKSLTIKIKSKRISSILTFENLKLSKLNGDIHSIYQDDDELVVFLQNGLNLYYNKFNKKKFLLTKIISPDENSRKLVKSTMNLCSKN